MDSAMTPSLQTGAPSERLQSARLRPVFRRNGRRAPSAARSRGLPLLVVFALAGCASSGGTGAGARGPSDACWPVAPLEVQALEHGREWEPITRLAADGTVSNRRGRLGRIDAASATFSARGAVWLEARCDGRSAELTSPLNPALTMRATYDARDAFNESGGLGARIYVADDGTVEMKVRADQTMFGRPGSGGGAVRVVGDVRTARRTAALLVFTTVATGAGR
jgi:hypothetical protein